MRLIHSSLILRSNFCLKAVIKTKAWYDAVEMSPSLPLRLHTDVSTHPSRQTWSLESPAEIRMPRKQAVYQNAFSGPRPSETASGSEDTSVLETFIHTHPHPHRLIIRFYCRDLWHTYSRVWYATHSTMPPVRLQQGSRVFCLVLSTQPLQRRKPSEKHTCALINISTEIKGLQITQDGLRKGFIHKYFAIIIIVKSTAGLYAVRLYWECKCMLFCVL